MSRADLAIDLGAAPFNLGPRQLDWVATTLDALTDRQKAGQVLCPYLRSREVHAWTAWLAQEGIEPGAVMLTARTRDAARRDLAALQAWSPVPLLVAANLEAGAGNFLSDAESWGNPMQVAAAGHSRHAERLAVHCARIANDLGVNWAFAPVSDVAMNPRNPITNTRTFGDAPERVTELAETYVRELERRDIATSPKHFPGDGVDDRDQHLVTTTNSLSVAEWERSYGSVYRRLIAAGARTVMVGHIRHPALSRELVPGITGRDLMPATLAPELVTGVLRTRLGFNGLVVTDNSAMAGFTTVMPREQALPHALMAGCDVVLGDIDLREDFGVLCRALENGDLTKQRLDDAVRRVLAVKASLGLHEGIDRRTRELPDEAEERRWRDELAEASATLVKDTQGLLPLSAERHRRVLVYVLGDVPTYYDPSPPLADAFVAGLTRRDMAVTVRRIPGDGREIAESARLHEDFDLCVYFANLRFAGNSNTLRVTWSPGQGPDAPRHVASLPTVLVSVADPYLLRDMPMIRTAVNGYTPTPSTVDACTKVLFGEIEAVGKSPVDPFAGYWDAAL